MFPRKYQLKRKIVLHVTDCDIHSIPNQEEGTEVLVVQPSSYMKSILSTDAVPMQNSNIGLENSDQYVTDLTHMRSNVTHVSEEQLVTPSTSKHDPVLPHTNSPSDSVAEVAAEKDSSTDENPDEDVGDCTLFPEMGISQASSVVSDLMTEEHTTSTDDQDDGQGHVSDAHSTQPSSCGQASPVLSPVASHGDKDGFAGLVDEILQAVQPSTSWAGQQNDSAVSPVESIELPDLELFGSPPLLQHVSPPPTHSHSPPVLQPVSPLPTHVCSPMHLHNPLTTSTDYIHNLTSQCVSKVIDEK